MRLLKALFVLAICVAVLGFYRGWFTLSSSGPDAESNKVDVNLTVDPDKVKEDVERVNDKAAELGNQATDNKSSDAHHDDAMRRIDKTHALLIIRT